MSLIIDDSHGNITLTEGTVISTVDDNIVMEGLFVVDDNFGNLLISAKSLLEKIIYQDIHISDIALKEDYVQQFTSKNYQSAFNIIKDNSIQLDNKCSIASTYNNLIAILTELQRKVINQ